MFRFKYFTLISPARKAIEDAGHREMHDLGLGFSKMKFGILTMTCDSSLPVCWHAGWLTQGNGKKKKGGHHKNTHTHTRVP
jgi:hypothetical protein